MLYYRLSVATVKVSRIISAKLYQRHLYNIFSSPVLDKE